MPKTTKTTTKKTTTRKTTTRASVKRAPRATVAPVVTPEVRETACPCGHCHCGSRFGRFMKKLLIVLILFALGFCAGKMCCHRGMPGMRVQFADNGCMMPDSIKCPKLREALPAMDINHDGCVTREEYRFAKRHMRQEVREIQDEMEETVNY